MTAPAKIHRPNYPDKRKPPRSWTMHEIENLIEMRDVRHMKWIEIAKSLGRFGGVSRRQACATCCSSYKYWKEKFARQAAMRSAGIEPPKRQKPAARPMELPADAEPIAPPPSVAALLNAPVKRPRYLHDADLDLRARIALQGLTAGFLGDPPRGRSALDQREAQK